MSDKNELRRRIAEELGDEFNPFTPYEYGVDAALTLPVPRGAEWHLEYHPGHYCNARLEGPIRKVGPDGDMGSDESWEAESGNGDLAAAIDEAWLAYRKA